MEDWLKIAQKLPVGYKQRYVHCESTSNSSGIISFDGQTYTMHCFKCGETLKHDAGKLDFATRMKIRKRNKEAAKALRKKKVFIPKDFTLDIPKEGMLWLLKASITPYRAKEIGIGWLSKHQRVLIPVYNPSGKLIYTQARAVLAGQQPKYINPVVDKRSILYWTKPKESLYADTVVVTEDILSSVRVGKFLPTASLMGTKISVAQTNQLTEYKHVIAWLDPDEAGDIGSRKVRKAVGMLSKVTIIKSRADPKNLTDKEIVEILTHAKTNNGNAD